MEENRDIKDLKLFAIKDAQKSGKSVFLKDTREAQSESVYIIRSCRIININPDGKIVCEFFHEDGNYCESATKEIAIARIDEIYLNKETVND